MNFKKINEEKYLLRVDSNEDIVQEVISFCKDLDISSAKISGSGNVSEVVLNHFSKDKNKVTSKEIVEELTCLNIYGLYADKDLEAYATFANQKMNVFGGKIKSTIVNTSCEIFIDVLNIELKKIEDEELGVKALYI